jgi:hypothetical protein
MAEAIDNGRSVISMSPDSLKPLARIETKTRPDGKIFHDSPERMRNPSILRPVFDKLVVGAIMGMHRDLATERNR